MQWIVQHYDELPQVVGFLHPSLDDWHRRLTLKALFRTRPKAVRMVGIFDSGWDKDGVSWWKQAKNEQLGLNWLSKFLYDRNFIEIWDAWGMRRYQCCAESIVTRGAIRRQRKSTYQHIVEYMLAHPTQPWGYIMERFWFNLFTHRKGKGPKRKKRVGA